MWSEQDYTALCIFNIDIGVFRLCAPAGLEL